MQERTGKEEEVMDSSVVKAKKQLERTAFRQRKYSEIRMDGPADAMIYEFEMPQAIVGRLIGRFGNFVNKIKATTGANIIVKMHPTSSNMKICAVEGLRSEIEEALAMIRERFPANAFPYLSLEQTNDGKQPPVSSISFLPSNNKLSLIEGVINDVMISNCVTLDHIFVQQPTHPTYPALSRMHKILSTVYEQPGIPQLVRPFNTGVICVTRMKEKDWARAEVVAVHDEKEEVTVRLVDIGGYVPAKIEDLRQIRIDFVSIPFQATECRLANLVPVDESIGWSEEALTYFKYLTMGQILQAHVVGYSPGDSTALIHLYRLNADQTYTLINEEMVNNEYARWVQETEIYTTGFDVVESGEEEWHSDVQENGTEENDYSSVEGNDHSSIEGHEYLLLGGNDSSSSVEGHDHSSVEGNEHCSVDERLMIDGMDNLSIECVESSSIQSTDRTSSNNSDGHYDNSSNDGLSTSSEGDP